MRALPALGHSKPPIKTHFQGRDHPQAHTSLLTVLDPLGRNCLTRRSDRCR